MIIYNCYSLVTLYTINKLCQCISDLNILELLLVIFMTQLLFHIPAVGLGYIYQIATQSFQVC